MNKSIIEELTEHAADLIAEGVITRADVDDGEAHFKAFNEDYYIIYHSDALKWLEKHGVDCFDAIAYVIENEELHFGESQLKPDDINPERVVNLLVYFAGYEVDFDALIDEHESEGAE